MSHTYSQLLYHVVFSTKFRERLIVPELRDRLHPYMVGVVRNKRGDIPAIGGMPEHVHLLVRLKPHFSLSRLVGSVKANSSRFVREEIGLRDFAWQEGFSAFSVSQSGAAAVWRYIQRQEEHHRRRSFEKEWVTLLDRHGVEYDPADPFGDKPKRARRATHS
jgi:REP element-mobilizing transposase RayT